LQFVFTSERGSPFTTAARMVERAGVEAKLGFPAHPHMLRLCAGQQGPRYAGVAGLPRPPQLQAPGARYRVVAGQVQVLPEMTEFVWLMRRDHLLEHSAHSAPSVKAFACTPATDAGVMKSVGSGRRHTGRRALEPQRLSRWRELTAVGPQASHLKTARAFELSLPASIIAAAEEVIEACNFRRWHSSDMPRQP
jgi:hypothetical protein